ncbi:LOW QUALITY PROTEIN: Short-chain dehydrogenase [Phytophthora palmivora]|uniref:Short-chain dehydrogenase n=1 Tax=Phytophthora palmivora TaxID=4796 RepID=A0A2P4WZA4_9STRA|nr:LOW QUALITY PROTEIN: Short-chain dehydrogenase [Phytophthora palmivora]
MNVHTRTSVANAQETTNVLSDIVAEHEAARPSNMTKQYAPQQSEFKRCCGIKNYDDGCLVYEGKLVTFLKTFVIPRGNKRKKTVAQQLSMASIEAYAKAEIDLYQLQQSLKTNSHQHPHGKAYHDLFDTLTRKEYERKRKAYVDRGLDTVLDGFFLGHALHGRGEVRRFIELPDMLTLEVPGEGPQLYTPLVIEPRKDESARPNRKRWYDIHIINSANATKEMSYNTHVGRIKYAFEACGINSTVWTHANRGSGTKLAETYGATEEQIRRLGRWNAVCMEGCYLTALPKKAMRALAEFPTTGGSYWLRWGTFLQTRHLDQSGANIRQSLVFIFTGKSTMMLSKRLRSAMQSRKNALPAKLNLSAQSQVIS